MSTSGGWINEENLEREAAKEQEESKQVLKALGRSRKFSLKTLNIGIYESVL